MPRTLAIGDIHGCDRALEALLAELQPAANDTVVILGDVVDRGPDTKRCVEMLLQLQQRTQLVFLLGNHEEMLLDAVDTGDWLDDWLRFGGREMLESYGGTFDDIPEDHFEFLRSGRDGYETETHLFVHAAVDPQQPFPAQNAETLRWARVTGREPPHLSGKRVICGHTAQASGVPLVWPGWVCLDTCCYGGLYLTALDVDSNTLWQADQEEGLYGSFSLEDIGSH